MKPLGCRVFIALGLTMGHRIGRCLCEKEGTASITKALDRGWSLDSIGKLCLKKYWLLGPIPRDFDLIDLGCYLGIRIFQSSPLKILMHIQAQSTVLHYPKTQYPTFLRTVLPRLTLAWCHSRHEGECACRNSWWHLPQGCVGHQLASS